MADMTLMDLAEQAANTQNVYQNQKINQMKMQAAQEEMNRQNQIRQSFAGGMPNTQDLYKIDPEFASNYENNQLKIQEATRKFVKGAATDLYSRVKNVQDPNQQQAIINQYIEPLKPQLQRMGLPMSEPMTMEHLKMIMGSAGAGEYHPPVATSQGYLQYGGNGFEPMLNPQGQPYMPGAVDVGNKFDIGMAGSLSKLVEQGLMPLKQAQSILKGQVMGQGQPQPQQQMMQPQMMQQPMQQRQAPPVFIDQNMSPEDQATAQQDYNTYENNVASQNQKFGGIPTAGQREDIKTQADINKAVGVEAGKSQFEANRDLPAVIDQASNALDLIKKLKEHPGKAGFVGMPNVSGLLGGVRGTKEANFKSRLEQIKGQTFLQAFKDLKGAGQITEVEGQKATQAIARLDASQSEKEFDAALDDLSNIIDQGVIRAKTKAGGKNQSNNIKDDADAILRR